MFETSFKPVNLNRTKALPRLARKRAAEAALKTGYEIQAIAKELAPVDTGRLKANIEVTGDGLNTAVRVTSTVPYGSYPEYGTSRQAAQPHMRPAFYAMRSRLNRRLGQIEAGLGRDLNNIPMR